MAPEAPEIATTMRRGWLTALFGAAYAEESRRFHDLGRGAIGSRREAAAQALLEIREVREHDLARSLGIVPAHGLHQLLVRPLGRAPRLVVAHVADGRHEQLAVGLDGRLEDLVAGGVRELDVEIHARVGVRDGLPQERTR